MSAWRRVAGRLVRKSPVPLYSQIKDVLRERIAVQRDADHLQLPSERELAKELGVSRMTVRQAVRELSAEGALFTAPGRGTFLTAGDVTQQLAVLTSFSQEMTQRGLLPSSRTLEQETITDPATAAQLHLRPDEPIIRIRRLRLADDEPMGVEVSHLPQSVCPGLVNIDLDHCSLYEVLRGTFRLRLGSALQTIAAQAADSATAGLLRIERGEPILFVERTTLLEDGRPIEFVHAWYRGDRYHFAVRLGAARG